jgi:uncharacterized membrane protein
MTFPVITLCFLIGCVAGLRSMMAPAIVCAGAYLGWLHLAGTPFAFFNSRIVMLLFLFAAISELIVDKLPQTPARTAPIGLIARFITGALCGAALAESAAAIVFLGGVLGVLGATAAAFGGYYTRAGLVRQTHLHDFVVAVGEDLLAISGGLFVVSRM